MGSGSSMAALGWWGKLRSRALPFPCLAEPFVPSVNTPCSPPEPHWGSRKHQDQPWIVFGGFPLNPQPCSAYGIQLRDQGGRFPLIHPQNHHVRGISGHRTPMEILAKVGVLHPRAPPGRHVSISARILHASKKKGLSLLSSLPAQKSQRCEGPVMLSQLSCSFRFQ